jgi:hypothetical protein
MEKSPGSTAGELASAENNTPSFTEKVAKLHAALPELLELPDYIANIAASMPRWEVYRDALALGLVQQILAKVTEKQMWNTLEHMLRVGLGVLDLLEVDDKGLTADEQLSLVAGAILHDCGKCELDGKYIEIIEDTKLSLGDHPERGAIISEINTHVDRGYGTVGLGVRDEYGRKTVPCPEIVVAATGFHHISTHKEYYPSIFDIDESTPLPGTKVLKMIVEFIAIADKADARAFRDDGRERVSPETIERMLTDGGILDVYQVRAESLYGEFSDWRLALLGLEAVCKARKNDGIIHRLYEASKFSDRLRHADPHWFNKKTT